MQVSDVGRVGFGRVQRAANHDGPDKTSRPLFFIEKIKRGHPHAPRTNGPILHDSASLRPQTKGRGLYGVSKNLKFPKLRGNLQTAQ